MKAFSNWTQPILLGQACVLDMYFWFFWSFCATYRFRFDFQLTGSLEVVVVHPSSSSFYVWNISTCWKGVDFPQLCEETYRSKYCGWCSNHGWLKIHRWAVRWRCGSHAKCGEILCIHNTHNDDAGIGGVGTNAAQQQCLGFRFVSSPPSHSLSHSPLYIYIHHYNPLYSSLFTTLPCIAALGLDMWRNESFGAIWG